MKLFFNILTILFLTIINCFSQTTAIPDANFEQQLVTLGIDTNGANGTILNADAQAVTTLSLTGTSITNLSGLEAFVNVISLNLGNNQFTTVPLSTLTALESFQFTGNDLISVVDFTQNTALKILKLQSNYAVTGDAPLTTLNLASNINLQELVLGRFGNLSSLTLPATATLTQINITFIADPTLDFGVCSGLKNLFIQQSNVNTAITLPTIYTVLEGLYISNIDIPTIDLSNYINLKVFEFSSTYVENLILPNSTTLEKIYISLHDLQGIQNFASLPNLKDLYIRSNQTTPLTVNLSQNLLLTKLDLGANDMSTINLSQNTALNQLRLDSNLFSSIDLTQNVNLKDLTLSNNLFALVDVTQNTALEFFEIRNNLLPSLNVTQNINMWYLDISNNLFTSTGLTLTNNILLRVLRASFNQISSLNITQNVDLNYLQVDHNLFTGTDIIQQYYNIRAADFGIGASQTLDVSFNQLSGTIPNIVSLIDIGNNGNNAQTNYYELKFDNNNFQFGDFEAQHLTMISYLPLQNQWGNDIIRKYSYAPQAKVNTIDTINATAGTPITLTTVVSGAQNHYKWFKNNVEIIGAPDSPNYVINSVNPCDQGVYYCEILSNLVPFENANPPGTQGKNLKLTRNNITLNVAPVTNSCPTLTYPLNGAINVPINPNITWADSPNACSYSISIGTNSGGTQILNSVNVGDVNFYTLASNLPVNTQIFVTITPNYLSGPAPVCAEQSFTTGTLVAVVPTCVTAMDYPDINEINIPVNTNFAWIPVANATGYTVTMTTSSGIPIAGSTNLVTYIFNPTADLPQGQSVYLTIIPFNADGNAIGCSSFQFTVETIPNPPTCPTSYSLTNGQTNVSVNLGGISWASVSSQTIYNVSIGTSAGGTDFVNYFFNNTSEYFDLTGLTFAYNTTYYLTITVEDQSTGNTTVCSSIAFTTENAPLVVPLCITTVTPANNTTDILVTAPVTWDAVSNATGYLISIGTTSGGTNIENNLDLGNSLTYSTASNFNQNTTYFVTITPYNSSGNAVGCAETQFTTQTIVTIPTCTTLVSPTNGSTNVAINSNISWNAIANATGYFISIGTTAGGTNFVNNFDNGNSTTFNPTTDFAQNTTYYVTITPYNTAGNATACVSESFTTQTIVTIPNCTTLVSPISGSTNVAINSNLSWNSVPNATGYFISIGTTSGGNQIANMIDTGNLTNYNPGNNFSQNTTIYITVTPYNSLGNAIGCLEESFTTETITVAPNCTNLLLPLNNATNVSINSNITWNPSSFATGYFITVGTSPGAGQIENMLNVGNVTTYNPPANAFSLYPTIYVTITPYNSFGNAIGCTEESFSTELANLTPNCTNLSYPQNGEINVPINENTFTWNIPQLSIVNGYYLSIGTTSNGSEIINNLDVGNTTIYTLSSILPYDSLLYASITPYNTNGSATSCSYISFSTISSPVPVITIPSFFTPNGDTFNDNWSIDDPKNEIKTIYIFDRYGKQLKQLSANGSWNGTFDNQNLIADDYWYVVELKNNSILKGHFSIKR